MPIYGPHTICSDAGHHFPVANPVPGVAYACRRCGATLKADGGPSHVLSVDPQSAANPTAVQRS